MKRQFLIPNHFNIKKVGEVWRVPYEELFAKAKAFAKQNNVVAAATDKKKISLVAIDVQNTFCIPGFELFVGGRTGNGAVDDNIRLCEFIYRNLGMITEIAPTMDTHTAIQIFHQMFWADEAGDNPPAMTIITYDDVVKGKWRVNPAIAAINRGDIVGLQRHALNYVKRLSDGGKYPLIIWPFHAMLGGIGHALVSAVEEALFFHAVARKVQTDFQIKGGNPLTENYSVLRPEVLEDANGRPIAQKNAHFIEKLLKFDIVAIAGQAKSHCVASTIGDLLEEINSKDPALAKKVYLIEDCTSPVVVPGIVDFTDQADAAFKKFADAGMNIVKSTDPIETWPGINL